MMLPAILDMKLRRLAAEGRPSEEAAQTLRAGLANGFNAELF
jgi:hypothetical protein